MTMRDMIRGLSNVKFNNLAIYSVVVPTEFLVKATVYKRCHFEIRNVRETRFHCA